ncbi:DNA-binding protein [Rhizobium sp. L245/93]|nr:DNA-binding protein [Rhizobium sp. L245/93]
MQPTYLTAPQVRLRYGITDMTLWRWARDEKMEFPKPLVINRRKLFKQIELEAWEQSKRGRDD